MLPVGTSPPRTKGAARWSRADMALLDELTDVLTRTPSLGHVVLDEAQDLSPMQLRAVGRRCSTGSVTVLGDIAQGTTPWATATWEAAMAPPRQARPRPRRARPRLPRARTRHRLRGAAAARTWRPGSARRSRCATTRAGSTIRPADGRSPRRPRCVLAVGRRQRPPARSASSPPTPTSSGSRPPSRRPASRTAGSTATTATTRTTRSRSCRRASPRASSSTGPSSSSRPRSPRPSPTRAPGCGGSTSCSPAPSRS